MSSDTGSSATRLVTAVVVSHDGARWIPTLVGALDASTVAPDTVVCVDTGSVDSSRDLLGQRFTHIVDAPAWTGFGAAVGQGLASLGTGAGSGSGSGVSPGTVARDAEWLWLLHDDCAPAPDALERLLATAATDDSIAVVGCRVRSWPRARRLLEVGVSITGTGRRHTGLEPGEYDQGQLDDVREVLAVSSAGMLVRRAVWDRLGGFDPRLPLFRDDVDFGWRVAKAGLRVVVAPDAVVFHAEAATRGARAIACAAPDPHRADRQAALLTLLANCSAVSLPWQYLRLSVGTVLRALGYLVGKLPSAAAAELAALVAVLSRPRSVLAARKVRSGTSRVAAGQLGGLFPPWWAPYLDGVDALASRFTSTGGTSADEPVAEPVTTRGAGAWLRTHALGSLLVVLAVAGVVAARGLLGDGQLHGGALLPAPSGATDWWRLYGQTSHDVALGSNLVTAPYVAVLAAVATVLLGKAWLVVDLLMLLAAPLAAVGAYAAARRLVTSTASRIWMTATYALLPLVTGAVTTGHVGTVAGAIVLPWLVPAVAPMFDRRRPAGWRPVFATGLLLSVVCAFAPVAWPMAAVLLVIALATQASRRRPARSSLQGREARRPAATQRTVIPLAVSLLLPLVLLAPWSLRVLARPSLLLTEAGLVDPATRSVSDVAWQLPFGRLAAEGAAPWWLGTALLVAAVLSILRRDSRARTTACWLVIAVSLATVAILAHEVVAVPGTLQSTFAWVGFPVLVAQAAAVVAVGLASDGLSARLASGSFGVRQPLVAAVGVAALVTPVAWLVWWAVAAPHGDLSRSRDTTLPAYLSDALVSDPGSRALILRRADGLVSYQLVAGDGLRLGDDSVIPLHEPGELTELVTDLFSQPRPGDVGRLAGLGVAYVLLPTPATATDVAALDGLSGLTRVSTDVQQLNGWQVPTPATGLGVFGARRAYPAPAATDGDELPALADHRPVWLVGESLAWVVAIVLAAPSVSSRAGISRVEA